MKNLFTLFAILLSLGITNAQTKKPVAKKTETPTKAETPAVIKGPTKEETIEYIKNEIGQGKENLTSFHLALDDTYYQEFIEYINISDCEFTFKHRKEWERTGSVEYEITIIPLDKIQNIEIIIEKKEGVIKYFQIKFTTYQKHNLITKNETKKNHIFLSLTQVSSKNSEAKPTRDLEKLTKAFNHLRKLCGAPEPISFD